jgi:hypothetical protein
MIGFIVCLLLNVHPSPAHVAYIAHIVDCIPHRSPFYSVLSLRSLFDAIAYPTVPTPYISPKFQRRAE